MAAKSRSSRLAESQSPSQSPSPSPSRRQVIAGAIGTGFALAALPVSASTISTNADGLEAGDVKISTGAGGGLSGYRAVPAKRKGKAAMVLVVHEIFGVHEHIRDVCRRLAKQGYFAVAPDLFARQGDVLKVAESKELVRGIVAKVPDEQVLSDLDATVEWARAGGVADVARLGITGFCWGGRIVWLYAARSEAVKAGVAWYGRLTGDKDPLHPQHPVDVGAAIKFPVLGLYGGRDQGITQENVSEMRKVIAGGSKAAQRSEIKVYPDAGHAFFADYRPSFHPEAATDGWRRMLAWLKAHGVAA